MARLASDSKTDLNTYTMEWCVEYYAAFVHINLAIVFRPSQNTGRDIFISTFQ